MHHEISLKVNDNSVVELYIQRGLSLQKNKVSEVYLWCIQSLLLPFVLFVELTPHLSLIFMSLF